MTNSREVLDGLFASATSLSALTEAYAISRSKGKATGGDGVTLEAFGRNAAENLLRLHQELQSGQYQPGPLRRLAIKKKSGSGQRVLSIPCLIDRIAQRAVAIQLTPALELQFNDSSYGYREGRSVQQAVGRVEALRRAGYSFVVDADIRAYFDNVPHNRLLEKLRVLGCEADLLAFLELALASFSGDGIGLAQGSPLSPLLANLYLDALDDSFEGGPIRIVRFADDFVLLAKSQVAAEHGLQKATSLLTSHGLELHPEKTSIVPFEKAFSFLGYLFVRSIALREAGTDAAEGPRLAIHSSISPGMRDFLPDDEELKAAQVLDTEPPILADGDVAPRRRDEIVIDGNVKLIRKRRKIVELEDPLADIAGDRDQSEFSAGLAPLYVLERGRKLRADHMAFEVRSGDSTLLKIMASSVGRIDLGPDTEADDQALRLAASLRIPVTFLDGYLQPEAVLMPADGGRNETHLAQARAMLDETRRTSLACGFVRARIQNAHALLHRLNSKRRRDDVAGSCEILKRLWKKLEGVSTAREAMQIEAQAAIAYWPALGHCLDRGFGLTVRRESPVSNPVNAVLNLTAHLLLRDMRAATLRAGLHAGFGYLHATDDDKEPCVYDLVESFRAPLSEGLSVYLFNNRQISYEDFVERDGELRMLPIATKRVVGTYERWLQRPVKNPRTRAATTWRGLLLHDARALVTALQNGTDFLPYRLDY